MHIFDPALEQTGSSDDDLIDPSDDSFVVEQWYQQKEELEAIERSLFALEHIYEMGQAVLNHPSIPTPAYALYREETQSILDLHGLAIEHFVPSLESIQDPRLAIEAVQSNVELKLRSLGDHLKRSFLTFTDTLTKGLSFFDMQKKRLTKVQERLKSQSDIKTVRLRTTTSLAYGTPLQAVTDAKDYIKRYAESSEFIISYMKTMARYIFSNERNVMRVLDTFTDNKNVLGKVAGELADVFKKFSDLPGMKEHAHKGSYVSQSPVYLGAYQLDCSYPDPKEIKLQKPSSKEGHAALKKLTKLFKLELHRQVMLDKSTVRQVELELTEQHLDQLLDITENLIIAYRHFNSLATRNAQSNAMTAANIIPSYLGVTGLAFASYRLLVKVAYIIGDNVGGVFIVSKNLTKQALTIAEKT